MGLEATTTIAGLVSSNPTNLDGLSQADDHMRLIKTVLKNIFPGVGGTGFNIPITAKESEINFLVGVTSAVQTQLDSLSSSISSLDTLKAPKASPTFTGIITAPSATGLFEIKTGTGDGASTTIYNTTILSHYGIGFRDFTDSSTVKAFINCRSGEIYAVNTIKAAGSITPGGFVGGNFNISSVTSIGTGFLTVNYISANSNGVAVACADNTSAQLCRVDNSLAGSCNIKCYGENASSHNLELQNPALYHLIVK